MSGPPPHFIIIGAMKCGTSTLHAQLARRAGIFMTTPKEPQFFSDDEQYARGPGSYRALFRTARAGQICGESSTHYSKLPTYPETVARMQSYNPALKLVYVMRDPIHRIVSQYQHEASEREVSEPFEVAVQRHERFVAYSCYARQLEPFLDAFGSDQVLPVFFERLIAHPDSEFARICRFVSDPSGDEPRWEPELDAVNVSSERVRSSALRERLLAMAWLRTLKDRLPQRVRDVLKSPWRMPERPVPSPELLARLEDQVDFDLKRLGAWLGLEISCGTWVETARSAVAENLCWKRADE